MEVWVRCKGVCATWVAGGEDRHARVWDVDSENAVYSLVVFLGGQSSEQ
jgi:hypothetical protein